MTCSNEQRGCYSVHDCFILSAMNHTTLTHPMLADRGVRLFLLLAGFFMTNALVGEFVGVKIFALETTLGLPPLNWSLFGQVGTLNLSGGVIMWPIVFTLTDIINEYFGKKGVRLLSNMTVMLIAYAYGLIWLTIHLSPADFWLGSYQSSGVENAQKAFAAVYGQSNWIIVGSMVAFLLGQILDVYVFHRIRGITGEKRIWLRALISTGFSQLVDSYVVLYIAFALGPQHWPLSLVLAVGTVNYCYKVGMAILLLPLLYLVHYVIERYLGQVKANELKEKAAFG